MKNWTEKSWGIFTMLLVSLGIMIYVMCGL